MANFTRTFIWLPILSCIFSLVTIVTRVVVTSTDAGHEYSSSTFIWGLDIPIVVIVFQMINILWRYNDPARSTESQSSGLTRRRSAGLHVGRQSITLNNAAGIVGTVVVIAFLISIFVQFASYEMRVIGLICGTLVPIGAAIYMIMQTMNSHRTSQRSPTRSSRRGTVMINMLPFKILLCVAMIALAVFLTIMNTKMIRFTIDFSHVRMLGIGHRVMGLLVNLFFLSHIPEFKTMPFTCSRDNRTILDANQQATNERQIVLTHTAQTQHTGATAQIGTLPPSYGDSIQPTRTVAPPPPSYEDSANYSTNTAAPAFGIPATQDPYAISAGVHSAYPSTVNNQTQYYGGMQRRAKVSCVIS